MLKRAVAQLLVVSLLATAALSAQDQDLLRSVAGDLRPGQFVVVTLAGGKILQGHVLRVTPEDLVVLPKTRIAVPARDLRFGDIVAIDPRPEGMSPGAKVLVGVGAAAATLAVIFLLAMAGNRY